MSKPSLEEWIEQHSAAKKLRENLAANIDVFTDLDDEHKGILLRLNMIMVRQFAQDCGLE